MDKLVQVGIHVFGLPISKILKELGIVEASVFINFLEIADKHKRLIWRVMTSDYKTKRGFYYELITMSLPALMQVKNCLQVFLKPTSYTANILRFSPVLMHITVLHHKSLHMRGRLKPFRPLD